MLFRTSQPIALAAALSVLPVNPARADGPSLKDVMRRVAAYVQAYGDQASIVVATERYQQTLSTPVQTAVQERTIVADFAIVRAEAYHVWLGFRDVYEVDGYRIPDRADRLVDVLTRAQGTFEEALRINDESARYNIGTIERNFNVPTTALFFFTRDNLDRFKFSVRDRSGPVWEIAYRETDRPTLIRTTEGKSIPSAGTVWVDPSTGTVVRTHLTVKDFIDDPRSSRGGHAELDVTYRRVDALDMWLPETMTESYVADVRPGWTEVTGRAEYSNYRRFQTSVRIKDPIYQ